MEKKTRGSQHADRTTKGVEKAVNFVMARLVVATLALVLLLAHRWWAVLPEINGPVGLLFSLYLMIYAAEQGKKERKNQALFYFFFGLLALFAAGLALFYE